MAGIGNGRLPTRRWVRPEKGDQIGPNPTDRAKPDVEKSRIVEGDGEPLGITAAGANVPDAHRLVATIEAIVLDRPPVEEGYEQHLAMDKGYDYETSYGACLDHEYIPHIALKRDERPPRPIQHPARLSMCRGLLVRWEKKAETYLGLLKLACGLLWFRRYHRLADLR